LATCFASVLWLAHFTTLGPKLLADDYPKSLDEVRAHVEKLERATDLEVKGYDYQEKSDFRVRRAINGELKLVEYETKESDGKFFSEVHVRSREYYFTATRTAPNMPWLLTEFTSPIDGKAEKIMADKWNTHGRRLDFREHVAGNRLRAFLAHPEIVEIKLEPPESDGLVKLTMNVPNPNVILPDKYGPDVPLQIKEAEVRLDPSKQYCVAIEYTVSSRIDGTGTEKVLEWGEKDGRKYPLKSVRSHSKVGDMDIFEVTSIRFDEVPESEFTLEAFGIPNPYDSAPSDTLRSPTLIMAIAGVAFLGVGFAFRFAQRR
jgi:hypothetical protein